MWTINLALGYISAILCMATGVVFNYPAFVWFSMGLALVVFVLNKTLERRVIHQFYYQHLKPLDSESWD
jgi:hypothetical protein